MVQLCDKYVSNVCWCYKNLNKIANRFNETVYSKLLDKILQKLTNAMRHNQEFQKF